jgi:hypothetical protein
VTAGRSAHQRDDHRHRGDDRSLAGEQPRAERAQHLGPEALELGIDPELEILLVALIF